MKQSEEKNLEYMLLFLQKLSNIRPASNNVEKFQEMLEDAAFLL